MTYSRLPPVAAIVIVTLQHRTPYDWDAMLDFFGHRAIPDMERVDGDRYTRAVAVRGVPGTIAIRPASSGALEAEIRFPQPTALPEIVARLRRLFDLDTDTGPARAHLARDPELAARIRARPGLAIPGAWDGFEMAVRAVLGQQITVVAAAKLAGRIVSAAGARLSEPVEGVARAFPEPEAMLDLDSSLLRMPRARTATLRALAAAAIAEPDLFAVGQGGRTFVSRIRRIRGIGDWTAQYVAMRHLREPDAFPASDIGLLRALAAPDGRRPTPEDLARRAEAWRPWRAYAAQYLWSVDLRAAQAREDPAVRVSRED